MKELSFHQYLEALHDNSTGETQVLGEQEEHPPTHADPPTPEGSDTQIRQCSYLGREYKRFKVF